jgi:hypothetical protein
MRFHKYPALGNDYLVLEIEGLRLAGEGANAPRVYALTRRLVLSMKLIFVVAFGLVFRTAVEVAVGKATGLPGWFLPAVLGASAGVILVTFVRMSRARAELRG